MMVRKIEAMHRLFGVEPEHKCGECSNLISERYHDKTYRKCKVYGVTNSEASDWAKKYEACGLFNKESEHHDVIHAVTYLIRGSGCKVVDEQPLDGQIVFWEE